MRASCQGCGVTLPKSVPDTCPVCGRTPPVVIAPDTRPEWQRANATRQRRLLYLFIVIGGVVAFVFLYYVLAVLAVLNEGG